MLVLFIILTPNSILEKTVADTIIAPRFTVDIANPKKYHLSLDPTAAYLALAVAVCGSAAMLNL